MKDDLKNTFLLYHDKDGKADVSVRFADEDVWVTQVQLAELYETTRQNIGQHIEKIYVDNELPREATIKKFFIVQYDGRNIANMYEKSYFDTLCQNDLLFFIG